MVKHELKSLKQTDNNVIGFQSFTYTTRRLLISRSLTLHQKRWIFLKTRLIIVAKPTWLIQE